MRPFEAAREATAEIGLAGAGDDASLVVIFVRSRSCRASPGRFLYQFGITAAVAVLVSLLVSFTLTPMMSARLLRAEDATGTAARRHGDGALAQRLLRAASTAATTRLLRFAMRHRRAVGARRLAVIAVRRSRSTSWCKQEYIPSDVDEAEFEVSVTAPEGTSLAAMDEAMQADRGRAARRSAACARCWPRPAAASSAASTRAASTCASRRTRSARSRSAGSVRRRSSRPSAATPSAATTASAT